MVYDLSGLTMMGLLWIRNSTSSRLVEEFLDHVH